MKRAVIINQYWDTLGGGERYVSSFVKFLLDLGWQVDIRWPGNISTDLNRQFGLDLSRASFVPEILDFRKYDLAFWVSDGSLPISSAKKTLIHFQFPFRNIGGRTPLNFIKSRFYTFVVNSNFTKGFVDQEFSVKSRVVYPPVSVEDFLPGVKDKTILYVGRFSHLSQQKGHDVLIKSFANISPMFPEWKLVLAGGTSVGSSTDGVGNLKKLASQLPVEFVFDPDFNTLKSLYSKASLFWSASGFSANEQLEPLKVEHFGITLVEAMASGCVPLAVSKGGHKEIVSSGQDGFLWSETSQLEEFTKKLISDPLLMSTLSQAAVKKSKMFSVSVFNSEFKKILHI